MTTSHHRVSGEFRQVYQGIDRSVVVSKAFLLAENELTAV
jgi:hypothetical protein